jgi:WD40 repeat protein
MTEQLPIKLHAPNPKTAQGYASCFVLSKDKKWLGYCVKNIVVLRNMENLTEAKSYTKHICEVTAVAFHPEGKLVASADVKGNISIWFLEKLIENKRIENAFSGKINGLDFTEDGTKLLIYGEGKKKFGRVINWELKNDVGEIGNVTVTLISGCFSTKKPYRVMVGGDDGKVNFYEGPPFKYKCEFKEHAGKFVSAIQCSPDGTRFVSAGFDKKIVIYDAKEGTILDQFDASKVENGHKMAIVSLSFIDDEKIVTASIDRSVKVWDLKEKKLLFTLIPAEGKLGIPFIFCGVQCDGKKVVAVSLSGTLYSWNVDSFADNKLPDLVLPGHQFPVSSVVVAKNAKEIISGDTNNVVLVWPESGVPRELYSGGKDKKGISNIALSFDESLVYVTEVQGSLLCFDRVSGEKKFELSDIKGNFKGLVPSRKNNEEVFALQTKILFKIKNGAVEKKTSISFESKCLEVNEELGEVLVGDKKGKLHVFDLEFKEKSCPSIHFGEYQVIKLSPDGKLIASGDNQRIILVYEAESKKVVCDRFGFHTGSIFDLDWSGDSKFLASASLDGSVMIWEIETKKRLKNYPNFDGNQINGVRFINDNKDVVCAGQSCNLKEIAFQ